MRPSLSRIARVCTSALSEPRSEVVPVSSQWPMFGICGVCGTTNCVL